MEPPRSRTARRHRGPTSGCGREAGGLRSPGEHTPDAHVHLGEGPGAGRAVGHEDVRLDGLLPDLACALKRGTRRTRARAAPALPRKAGLPPASRMAPFDGTLHDLGLIPLRDGVYIVARENADRRARHVSVRNCVPASAPPPRSPARRRPKTWQASGTAGARPRSPYLGRIADSPSAHSGRHGHDGPLRVSSPAMTAATVSS